MRDVVKIDDVAYLSPYLITGRLDGEQNPIKRPILLVLPGGAYRYCSDREAEPVALRANSYGMHAVVLRYTCLPENNALELNDILAEVEYALNWIDSIEESYYVDKSKIFVVGFSAGGHLAAWSSIKFSKRIAAAALAYAAIGFTEEQFDFIFNYTIENSDEQFSEEDLKQGKQMRALFTDAPINALHSDVPRTFLFHTADDNVVPAVQSLAYSQKLIELGIPCELHMYEAGGHGLSLADQTTMTYAHQDNPRVQSWFELAVEFFKES